MSKQVHSVRSNRFAWRGILWVLGGLLAAGLWGGPVRADQNPTPPTPPTTSVTTSDYVIGVDDVIQVSAVGQDEINQTVTVLSDGTIHVNGIDDDIKVEGMTLAQLKDRLYKGLSRLYNNLELSVSIKETHSRNVTIIGAKSSGQFPLRKDMRVSTLLALAGGLPAKPTLVTGLLIRGVDTPKPTRIKLDIPKIASADQYPGADLPLQNGDMVVLDTKDEPPPPTYSVFGAVNKTGSFPMPLDGSPITVARAVADAGGQTDKAALASAFLIRKGRRIPLNLYTRIVDGKMDGPESQMTLQDGDELHIPDVEAKYMVLGDVNHPNAFPLPETQKVDVMQALAEAGGATTVGDLRKAGIVRKVNGKATFVPVNLQAMITQPAAAKNITMQDGDVLYIPSKRHSFGLGDVLSPLWILSAFGFRPFQ